MMLISCEMVPEASISLVVPSSCASPGPSIWPQPGSLAQGLLMDIPPSLLPLLQLGLLPKVPRLGESGIKMNPIPLG